MGDAEKLKELDRAEREVLRHQVLKQHIISEIDRQGKKLSEVNENLRQAQIRRNEAFNACHSAGLLKRG